MESEKLFFLLVHVARHCRLLRQLHAKAIFGHIHKGYFILEKIAHVTRFLSQYIDYSRVAASDALKILV
jgi:hypothetical protein